MLWILFFKILEIKWKAEMERNTDYNKRIYLNANIARTILKRWRAAWRPGLAHHTSRKGEPADRERKEETPTALLEHTTPSTCVSSSTLGRVPQWAHIMVDPPGGDGFLDQPVVPHCSWGIANQNANSLARSTSKARGGTSFRQS